MNREQTFLTLLHVLTIAFVAALLLPRLASLVVDGLDPDPMTRSSYVAEYEYLITELQWSAVGAVLGLIVGYVSWHRVIRKHPALDEKLIALGCLVFLLVLPASEGLIKLLSRFI